MRVVRRAGTPCSRGPDRGVSQVTRSRGNSAHLVRSETLHHVHLRARTTRDDRRTVILRKLNGNRADRTATAVDHDALVCLQVAMFEETLIGGHADGGKTACLVEWDARGFANETGSLNGTSQCRMKPRIPGLTSTAMYCAIAPLPWLILVGISTKPITSAE